MIPEKLKKGDEVRIIVLSTSFSVLSKEQISIANERLKELGLKVSFGKHIKEMDDFMSTSIESRVEDFHDAFLDKNVKAILTALGGFNANQLLDYIDWKIVKKNPKIFCGYSDITIFNNSIYAKTGLVNYYGPHYSTFGQKLYFDYTLEYFKKCVFFEKPYLIKESKDWSDDNWYLEQEKRTLINNEGYWVINEGVAEGIILGGNLQTFNLLQGTRYFPCFKKDKILFLEDDELTTPEIFDRCLQSVMHQPNFNKVRGIIIGRFQKASKVDKDLLFKIIETKKELKNIPIVANADFGHTSPMFTFPIGGSLKMDIKNEGVEIMVLKH